MLEVVLLLSALGQTPNVEFAWGHSWRDSFMIYVVLVSIFAL